MEVNIGFQLDLVYLVVSLHQQDRIMSKNKYSIKMFLNSKLAWDLK